jgi:hypothetical protein
MMNMNMASMLGLQKAANSIMAQRIKQAAVSSKKASTAGVTRQVVKKKKKNTLY